MIRTALLVICTGCAAASPTAPDDTAAPGLPEDRSEPGLPVGVTTLDAGERQVEVWYPAIVDEAVRDIVALADVVPDTFLERVDGTLELPSYPQAATRDAAADTMGGPWPVVLFSHGFGGFRSQSTELTAHLASRGYVVVSTDHPGRTLGDIVPCLLDPPAGECTLSFPPDFDAPDPALDDLAEVLTWLEAGPDALDGMLDLDRLGIFGHSAGGASTVAFTNDEPRIVAALPLAGGSDFTRSVPSAIVGGACDGVVQEAGLAPAGSTTSEGYYSLLGVGHLAFSDLCLADLGALGDALEQRDDADALFLLGLRALATDGCPGATPRVEAPSCDAFLPLDRSGRILREVVTVFFDQQLGGAEEGLSSVEAPELVLATAR